MSNNSTVAPVTSGHSLDLMKLLETKVSIWLWRICSPTLLVVGVTGNILVLWALKRLKFTKSSTLVHLFVLAISDMVVLCTGLSRYWLLYTFDYNVRLISDAGCKVNLYVMYTFTDFSSWILVSVTIERLISVTFPLHVKVWCTAQRAYCKIALIYVLLTFLNGYMFWSKKIVNDNGYISCTSEDRKLLHFDEYIFVWIDLCFVSLIPFLIMFICNCIIVHALRKASKAKVLMITSGRTSMVKGKATTRLLLFVTTFFFFTTLPSAIYFILDSIIRTKYPSYTNARMDLAWTVTYLIFYTNFSANFMMYTSRNQKFRKEVLVILRIRSRSIKGVSERSDHTGATNLSNRSSGGGSFSSGSVELNSGSEREKVASPHTNTEPDDDGDLDFHENSSFHDRKIMSEDNANKHKNKKASDVLTNIKTDEQPVSVIANEHVGVADKNSSSGPFITHL